VVESACWRQLEDRGPDLVLCLDFPGGRAAAGFAELAANAPVDARFLHLGPVRSADGPLRTLVDRWVREATGDVRAVLGFCAGASLATRVADAVIEAGLAPPEVLLFDAVTVTGATLCQQFVDVVEPSAEHLTGDELAGAHAWQERLLDRYPGDPPRLAEGLAARYDELMAAVAERLDLGEHFHHELTAGFTAYLDYLALAAEGGLDLRGGTPLFVSSRQHELSFEAARRLAPGVDREDLLRDPEVHKLVADLVRGVRR
jgi:hypothetical protein